MLDVWDLGRRHMTLHFACRTPVVIPVLDPVDSYRFAAQVLIMCQEQPVLPTLTGTIGQMGVATDPQDMLLHKSALSTMVPISGEASIDSSSRCGCLNALAGRSCTWTDAFT